MFVHCNLKFRADEIQFLYDNEHFIKRKLKIGRCPVCNKLVARLIETRIEDGYVSDVLYVKGKAAKLINSLQDEVARSSLDNIPVPKTLYGFRYGENTERINKKTGVVTVTQKACDFNGAKEVVKVKQITAKQENEN